MVDRAERAGSPSASSNGVSCGELMAMRSLTSSAASGSVAPAVYVAFPVKAMIWLLNVGGSLLVVSWNVFTAERGEAEGTRQAACGFASASIATQADRVP